MFPRSTASTSTHAMKDPRFDKPGAVPQVSPAGATPPPYAPANHPEFMPFR
jgi:hypothetical protein